MGKTIIINFPTNFGDTILGLCALDKIKASYPEAKITAIVSLRTNDFLRRNNFIDEVILFNKHWSVREKVKFVFSLRKKYDLIIDFKNSFLPVLLGIKQRTAFFRPFPKNMHIKDKYLALVNRFCVKAGKRGDFILTPQERKKWDKLKLEPSLFIACSSLSPIKSYPYDYLKKVVTSFSGEIPIVILGQEKDHGFYKDLLSIEGVVNLVGKTSVVELFYLVKNYARLLLAVDSSILHLGGYLNIPSIAFFGPTHPDRSAPFSEKSIIIRNKNVPCLACEKAECEFDHECMKIDPERVISVIKKLW